MSGNGEKTPDDPFALLGVDPDRAPFVDLTRPAALYSILGLLSPVLFTGLGLALGFVVETSAERKAAWISAPFALGFLGLLVGALIGLALSSWAHFRRRERWPALGLLAFALNGSILLLLLSYCARL